VKITTGRVQDKAAWQKKGWTAIDVTVKSASPKAKVLAPTWNMVMGYKKGTLSWEEYKEQYAEILEKAQQEERSRWENTLKRDKVVFLCYCPKGANCHRLLLAAEFKRFGKSINVEVELIPEE
jgi:uncharacterized protein YeaO (DUF488 family)